ncbi:hypothetical protein MesoLjLc_51180 [Mesorhizobium sp. L-8-10]|uniref:hypothetical protein n=1 Tax=Mesorhizobium sp. L-8-10 TaxID=2744523 RepID=UPI0019271F34|nr:hypothetical protein [Mesorhizobium sp. L-8-10]BCH33188.1 hypothetical protein MesoLjLc_51180 [Mesorhizobium sp. L-8-10]
MKTILEFIRLSAISASVAMIGIAAIAAAPEIARPAAPAYVILVETYSGGDLCCGRW